MKTNNITIAAVLSFVTYCSGFQSIVSKTLQTNKNQYQQSWSFYHNARVQFGGKHKIDRIHDNRHFVSITEDSDIETNLIVQEKKNDVLFPSKYGKSSQELLFNFLLLSSAFGFALFTILNIDHGMTRGWTQAEILTRVPFDNWRQYEDSLSEKPIFTKTMINVIIYLLGDWLSQTVFQEEDILNFDASRTIRNGFIGLCFGPLVHQYYEFSDTILPPAIPVNRIYKILMDQTIYLSVKCSAYIAAVGFLGGQSMDEVQENVKTRIRPIMFTAWKFWPLVHCVTYGVIPARHRILWVNSVDLIWNAILAQAVSKDDNGHDTNAGSDDISVNLEVVKQSNIEINTNQENNCENKKSLLSFRNEERDDVNIITEESKLQSLRIKLEKNFAIDEVENVNRTELPRFTTAFNATKV